MDERRLLHALAAPVKPDLRFATAGGAWTEWIAGHGLAPYVFYRLRAADALEGLSAPQQAGLRSAFYEAAGRHALQRQAAAAVLAALALAGVEVVLLKGAALACAVYPDPACRPMDDLDLWVQPEQRAAAIAVLAGCGYDLRPKADRPPALVALTGGEDQMVGRAAGAGMVELQFPALRGEWVRRTAAVDHAGMWARRTAAAINGQAAQVLAAEDMLIHLCVHLAVNHGFGEHALRNLLDVHLVADRLAPDWAAVVGRGRSWRLATVLWAGLGLAVDLWGAAVPGEVLSALAPPAWQRRAIGRLALADGILAQRPAGYSHRRFLIQWLMADRPRDAARLVWRGLFPETDWLAARYGASSRRELWCARLGHPLRVLISARG